MRLRVRENHENRTVEGQAARTLVRRALRDITAPIHAAKEELPMAMEALTLEAHKLRRRAVDCLQRGEWVHTETDEHGKPSEGLSLCVLVKIEKIIKEDGTEVVL